MANAETARGAGEAPIGDQCNFAAPTLTIERRSGRQHLAHSWAALWALVADYKNITFLVFPLTDRLEAGFLAVKAARWAREFQLRHSGNLNDRPFRREIAPEAHHAAGSRNRLVRGA